MCVVFRSDARVVLNQLLSPKLQFHIVGVPPVEASVNVTVSGADPEVGVPVKLATGGVTVVPVFTVYALRQTFAFGIFVVRSVQVVPVLLM